MFELPIIEKVTSQKCIGYEQKGSKFVSIIESCGIAKDGKRYRWLNDSWSNERGLCYSGSDYRFISIDQSEAS